MQQFSLLLCEFSPYLSIAGVSCACLKESREWRLEKSSGIKGKTSSLEEVPCAELYEETNFAGEKEVIFQLKQFSTWPHRTAVMR